MDEVLYYKAWVEELQGEIVILQSKVLRLQHGVKDAKESVADSLSYYFEKIASTISDAQEEIQEYML